MTDDELATLALAADPEAAVEDEAKPVADVLGPDPPGLLPEWYMPAPMAGASRLRGWRRAAAVSVIAAFLTITAAGLCNTYGQLPFG